MSKSRERRVKGFNKAPVRKVEDLPREAHAAAGHAGRIAAPSPEALMTFIRAQTCPWCGKGPYKLLAAHTNSAHGISAAELREMAGLIKTAAICSPEVSEMSRTRGRLHGMPEAARTAPRKRAVYSAAGREVNRAKSKGQTPEQRAAAAEASRAAALAANEDKHRQILVLFKEGKQFREIAATVGCSLPMVNGALERAGIKVDGRSQRWERESPERKAEQAQRFAAGLQKRNRKEEARRAGLVREYEAAGATYAAVRQLAAVHGTSVKSMAARLKEAGARLPDGRRDPRPPRFTEAEHAEMARMYLAGASQSEVGRSFGVNQTYVSVILRGAGVPAREFRRPRSSG